MFVMPENSSHVQYLDADEAWAAVEGYEDVLTPAVTAQEAFYRQFSCPRCKCDDMNKVFNPKTTFSCGTLIPKALLKCGWCALTLDPETGIVVESGNAAKAAPQSTLPLIPRNWSE